MEQQKVLNGRVFDPGILTQFGMANLVDDVTIQGWNNLFEPPVPYLHEPKVHELFYKMELLEGGGITTTVRNVEIHLDEETLGIILGVPVMGVQTIEGCKPSGDFSKLATKRGDLYGAIPVDISKLIRFVVTIDLSGNQFSREIPTNIANSSFLNSLKLDHNKPEGPIPPEIGLLDRLKTVNVTNNMLIGLVPNFVNDTFPAECYANNLGLCGSPLKECAKERVWNHHTQFVCSFVTGWSLFTLLGIYLFFFGLPGAKKMLLLIKKRTKIMVIHGNEWPQREEINNDPKILKMEKIITRMNFMELSKATSNFSQDNEIDNGMLGKVYKALVPNGWTVAIKRLHVSEDLEEEFVSEITTLGSLRHPNLVPLIGFCSERDERPLVYKYMPNGNLHEWLHSTEDKARFLDFALTVKIVIGVAKALAWLHDGGNFHVVHSNISTQCILLDDNFDPKLSNSWEATLAKTNDIDSNLSLLPIVESLDFTTYKKDVYQFGVVVLEILTRKESYILSCSSLNLSSNSFASPLDVDKLLLGQGFDNMVLQLLELASDCMKFIPDQRPTMQQVYQTIAVIACVHDQTGDPEIHFSLRCNAVQSDIDCLISIKQSLVDPLNLLNSTWKFDNQTEGFICKFAGIQCWHPDETKVLSITLSNMGLIAMSYMEPSLWIYQILIGYVVDVDLSSNQFSGAIPNNNKLEGLNPPEICSLCRLKTFNVANNMLTGPVPNFVNATFPAECYANNPGLCGSPLELCVTERALNLYNIFIKGFVTGWSFSTLLGIYLFFFGLPNVKKMLLWIKKRTKLMVIDGNEWRQREEVNNDTKILELEKIVTRMSFMEL
ncbi:hypothetical protein H5410_052096 [Solanum commersonii]|uniref:Protein kinase domain-containing protein n=1 Tax=Solanum commersonii TaxID=4109 RepID=A0A9J5X212_SOLCO|nr:hypothetical protein H5410_052096 [Solanum commersonii]